ncbi:MAG: ybbC [Chlamydiales bacterium]|jgi:uncharacterized protein YbbC (DUF1343 family)|nr:ybbC [Chlamydiales bacterium]
MSQKLFPSLLLTALFLLFAGSSLQAQEAEGVKPGLEVLFNQSAVFQQLKGKRVGLLTNQSAVSTQMEWSVDLFKRHQKAGGYQLVALFAPEHGLQGKSHASEKVKHEKDPDGLPIFSLHGETRRPTKEMLKGVDILVYDIQDIGCRSYTFISTLFYTMEEAAKLNIQVWVLDRPNPINGVVVDGPCLDAKWRSFVGYIDVPYCHGMTIGELSEFFNREYQIGCHLTVVPMQGWRRSMTFLETGLLWFPSSPQIPTGDTPLYYPMTGLLGELNMVSIGVGYTLPFKVIGAPWIDALALASFLNQLKLPGISFEPFHYQPFFGRFAKEACQGVLLFVKDPAIYRPVQTQYAIIEGLKALYPEKFAQALKSSIHRKEMFNKVNGTDAVYQLIEGKQSLKALKHLHAARRQRFLEKRGKYLRPEYADLKEAKPPENKLRAS